MAFKVNHFIKCRTRGSTQYMALKLVLSKAYDMIEWIILRRILLRLVFAESLVNTIMLCVSSMSYSFLLNGKQFGDLQPARGLHQGDPLSPYLFICYVEVFNRMVEDVVACGRLHGVRVAPMAPVISNLGFADDTVLFREAALGEGEEILRILNKYEQALGQIINLDKSTMTFSPGMCSESRWCLNSTCT